MYNLISVFVGALITIMVAINGMLADALGNYLSNVVIHLVGLISIIVVVIVSKYKFNLPKKESILIYAGGAVGVITVFSNAVSFTALGATLTIVLGLLGQVVSSLFIDHYGLFGAQVIKFNKKKILGLTLMILGTIIMTVC